MTYDVFFGTANPPANRIASNQGERSFNLQPLAINTNYFWKVVARDNQNNESSGSIWKFTTTNPPSGRITGIVRDAVSNAAISNVSVAAFKNTTLLNSGLTTSSGTYEVSLPADSGYRVVFSKTGYIDVAYQNINVTAQQNTILETVLQINQNNAGNGTISGTIRNALDATAVSGATLRLRAGYNSTSGTVLFTTSTSSTGSYSFSSVPAGNYTVEASKSGFNTTFFSAISLGGQTVGNQDGTMSPQISSGETRIVLTWGALPPDLDSHFTGPLPSGGRFHMYYPYKGSASPWPTIVYLDLDDVTSYGPETTTLYQQISGVYRFSVHDYTNRNLTNSLALSNSSAQVRVYKGSGLVATFNVPPNTGGTLWTVFEMDGGTITPINSMSYVSNPGDITRPTIHSDAELLRKLPPKNDGD